MKTLIRASLAAAAVLALALPAVPQQITPPSNFRTQDNDRREGRERHPHIRSAIRELQEAKRELQSAAHDFGGHREEALKACDQAINELQQALQYDKK